MALIDGGHKNAETIKMEMSETDMKEEAQQLCMFSFIEIISQLFSSHNIYQ